MAWKATRKRFACFCRSQRSLLDVSRVSHLPAGPVQRVRGIRRRDGIQLQGAMAPHDVLAVLVRDGQVGGCLEGSVSERLLVFGHVVHGFGGHQPGKGCRRRRKRGETGQTAETGRKGRDELYRNRHPARTLRAWTVHLSATMGINLQDGTRRARPDKHRGSASCPGPLVDFCRWQRQASPHQGLQPTKRW